jgi:hypothetical protein
MTAKKISDLSAVSSLTDATEYEIEQGTSQKASHSQLAEFLDARDGSAARTNTNQPGFSAFLSVDSANVTGTAASGAHTVIFDTEIFDQGAGYNNTTGVFTAPTAGKYLFTTRVRLTGMTTASDSYTLQLVTSNRNYFTNLTDSSATLGTNSFELTAIADMDVNDTASVTILVIEEASDVIDVLGDLTRIETYFSGWLLG